MEIFYTNKAAKQLENLPRQIKFAKRLTDYREGEFRFRVGEYRLIFDVVKDTIYILKIDKRDKIYD